MYILGNGCQFRNTEQILRDYFPVEQLQNNEQEKEEKVTYDLEITSFDAPMPMDFLSPHIMGVVTKKPTNNNNNDYNYTRRKLGNGRVSPCAHSYNHTFFWQ